MSTIPAQISAAPAFRRAQPAPWLTVRPWAAARMRATPQRGARMLRDTWWAQWQRAAAIAVALVATAVMLGAGLADTSIADVPAASPVSVVVQPGDTVWELARTHAPSGASVQDYASRVVIHNDITATALRPGTVLVLPQD